MANSTRKAQVLITANASQATQTIKDLQRLALLLADDINQATVRMQNFMKAGDTANAKAMQKNINEMTTRMQSYTQAVDKDIEKTKTLGQVIGDLANSKLRELKSAMGQGKSMLSALTGSDADIAKARQIQQQMKQIGDQIRYIEGEYVKVADVVKNLGAVSDTTLQRSIRQQQTLVEGLKRTDAEYANQMKVLRALKAEQASRNGVMSVGTARSVAQDIGKYSINDMRAAVKALTAEMNRLPSSSADVKKLRKEIELLEKEIKKTTEQTVSIEDVMRRMKNGKANLTELRQAYQQLENELKTLNIQSKEFADTQAKMRGIQAQINQATGAVNNHASAWKTAWRNISMYLGAMQMISIGIQKLQKGFSDNFAFSDELANIRKVSNRTTAEINDLARALGKIDTRTTIQELNQIAYAGAKLGMANYGVEGLEQFTEAANQVNVALKEDLGEEALTSLSKITEVMGLIPKMGVEQSMLKTGSAIFTLSTKSTATSKNIVEFSKRLLSLSKEARLTTSDLMALGSASDAMALMPEVASTAFNKLFMQLRGAPGAIEKALKIPKGTLSDMMNLGHGTEALLTVLQKMHDSKNIAAIPGLFKAIGSDGSRMKNVMVTMAKNVDMLRQHLDWSSEAFEKGIAITNEYNIQQNTAAALMERAGNMWEKAFVNPDQVDVVRSMAKAWFDVSKSLTTSSVATGVLVGAFNSLVFVVKMFLVMLPGLVAGLGVGGLVGTIASLGTAMTGLIGMVDKVRKAFMALSVAGKFSWIGAIIGGLVMLADYFDVFSSKSQKAAGYMEGFKKKVDALDGSLRQAEPAARSLKRAIDVATQGSKERAALISQFNKQYGTYISHLLTERSTALDVAKAYAEVVKQLKLKSLAELKQKDYDTYVTPAYGWEATRLNNYGNTGGNSGWLKGVGEDYLGKGKTLQQAVAYVAAQLGVKDAKMIADAYAKRSGASVPSNFATSTTRDAWGYERSSTRALTTKEQRLYLAAQYLAQVYSTRNRERTVDKKWGPYKDDLANLITVQDETDLGGNDVDTTPAGTGLKPEGPARPETPEDPLVKAKRQLSELRANIMTFYQQQMTAMKEDMVAQGTFDEETAEVMLKPVEQKMYQAVNAMEETFVLGTNAWADFASTMEAYDPSSFALLNEIQGTDVGGISKLANSARPKGWKAQKGLVSWINKKGQQQVGRGIVGWASRGVKPEDEKELYLAQTLYDSSRNDSKQVDIAMKQAQKRQKELLEHNYTGIVQGNSVSGLLLSGFAQSDVKSYDTDKQKIISTLELARQNIVDVLSTNGDKDSLLSLLFGENYQADLSGSTFAPLLSMADNEFKLFWQKLIQYSDEYTEAEKKNYDEQKKIIEALWKFSGNENREKKATDSLSVYNKLYGEKQNMGSQIGTAYASYDPELAMYQLKLEFAEKYYKTVLAYSQDVQLQQEAEQKKIEAENALAEKLVSQMKDRVAQLKQFMQPTEDAIEQIGEAWAEFSDSTESGQKAMINALKSFIKSYATMLIKNLRGLGEQDMLRRATDKMLGVQSTKAGSTQNKKSSTEPDQAASQAVKAATEAPVENMQKRRATVSFGSLSNDRPEVLKEASVMNLPSEDAAYNEAREKEGNAELAAATEIGELQLSQNERMIANQERSEEIWMSIEEHMYDAIYDIERASDKFIATWQKAYEMNGGVTVVKDSDDLYDRVYPLGQEEMLNEPPRVPTENTSAARARQVQAEVRQQNGISRAVTSAVDTAAQGGNLGDVATSVLGSAAKTGLSTALGTGGNKSGSYSAQEREQQRSYKKQQQAAKRQSKAMQKIEASGQADIVSEHEEANQSVVDLKTDAGNALVSATGQINDMMLSEQQSADQQQLQEHATKEKGDAALNSVGIYGQCVETFGPIAGPIIYAVAEAALMALLSFALSKIGGGKAESASTNTKLTSGMLTYDEGNVSQFVGSDGKVYAARDAGALPSGVSMVTSPIATTVNGQPSLVAERGPEIVIGRQTTSAIMQNAPYLLSMLAAYDKNRSVGSLRLFDEGNISDYSASSSLPTGEGRGEASDPEMKALMQAMLGYLQNPVAPNINMYGSDGLHAKLQRANAFMSRH